jgi:adenylate cyclase
MNIGNVSKLVKIKGVPRSILALAALIVLGIYLFATAPADLNGGAGGQRDVPVETLFRMLDAENASVRALYTSDIVGPGLKRGLKYREDWRLEDVHAGPLPALMLRETANRLQQRVPELNLFLGSTFPIEESNRFKGEQLMYFKALETKREPQFFLDASTGRHTAMFPDVASAVPCVSCHNEHPKSPRKDWKQNDVMGATTWSFPRDALSTEEVVKILAAYRAAALDSYGAYLKKTANFAPDERPEVGGRWPQEGLFLPDSDAFRERIEARNSTATLNALLQVKDQAQRAMPVRQDGKSANGAVGSAGKSEKAP